MRSGRRASKISRRVLPYGFFDTFPGKSYSHVMSEVRRFTAVIYRENGGYVALCPELDVASQGDSVEEASSNLREAVELFIETADPSEIASRMREELYVTALEVNAG